MKIKVYEKINKLFSVLIIMIFISFSLMGCVELEGVELSEDQSAVISEYAAGLLLKYDKSHAAGIQNVYDIPESEENNETEEIEEITEPVEAQNEDNNVDSIPGTDKPSMFDGTIDQAIGISDIDVTYSHFEVYTSYPDDDSDNLVFSMRAQDGNKMIVVHFNVTNPTDYAQNVDMITRNVRYRLDVNNGTVVRQQQTLLANDLSQMSEMLEAGQTIDEVLVFETEAEIADNITSMSLIIKGDEELTIQL